MSKTNKVLVIVAVVFFVVSAIMLFKGINKMTVYNNSDYESLIENAYVGGDAYNYIINGTYSACFFILSVGFFIGGMMCVLTAEIKNAILNHTDETTKDNERITGIQLPQ